MPSKKYKADNEVLKAEIRKCKELGHPTLEFLDICARISLDHSTHKKWTRYPPDWRSEMVFYSLKRHSERIWKELDPDREDFNAAAYIHKGCEIDFQTTLHRIYRKQNRDQALLDEMYSQARSILEHVAPCTSSQELIPLEGKMKWRR